MKCHVINPVSISKHFGKSIPPVHWTKKTFQGNDVEVFCPRFVSFSARRFWKINTAEWTLKAFTSAAEKVIRLNQLRSDAIYGHFIYPSGLAITNLSAKFNIPAFNAVGEGSPWSIDMLGRDRTCQIMKGRVNFLSVSKKAKKMLIENDLGNQDDIMVFPNGVNLDLFRPMSRSTARSKYGFPQDSFIVAFLGNFSTGKGISRLDNAIKGLTDVYAVYIGKGDCQTDPETTLFKGPLPHSEVPVMLNAADIFVLPTLAEGSSNATIEALACGLPVVSANYDFNDEILDDEFSIRVDPMSVDEIRNAILTLKQNPELRKTMGEAALRKAQSLDIRIRAANILSWMEKTINHEIKV